MLLLSLLNFLSGNLRQAVANPLRQGAVVELGRAFPQRSFLVVVSQWVILPRIFGHDKIHDNAASLVLTLEVQRKYLGRPHGWHLRKDAMTIESPGNRIQPLATIFRCCLGLFRAWRQTHDAF